MQKPHDTWPRGAREQLANEAARLMAEQGISDPVDARQKAARRLGLANSRGLPTGEEIVTALRGYLALFQAESHGLHLRRLRLIAHDAMRHFGPLADVRLVGPVLDGTAVAATPITLHLLGVSAEEVAMHMIEHGIPYRESSRTVSYGPRDRREVPAFLLRREEVTVELLAFAPDAPRQAPVSPLTGRAMQRAGLAAVEDLLADREVGRPASDPVSGC